MPEKVFDVSIVGLGHVASHHIAAIAMSPQFRLVAACDSDPARFSLLDPSVSTFTDIDLMLAGADVDAVIIASPNRFHVPHGIKVMAAGTWAVIEKPLAETREDFKLLEQEKAAHGARCTVALHAAFGVEVAWFCSASRKSRFRPGELRFFAARFYDPYIEDGILQNRARSLGGSWLDSGINALSVICRIITPEDLAVHDSRMTRLHNMKVQGAVDFSFPAEGAIGSGIIDTNWTLGRNRKTTTLQEAGGRRFILDHSAQRVIVQEGRLERVLFSADNGLPRLTNHYVGVFADLARQMQAGKDNFEYSRKLHEVLYQAEEWPSNRTGPAQSSSAEESACL